MENNNTNSIQLPSIIILAAFIIVIAGIMSAASIINAVLLAFFISIILIKPIDWLQKKKVPKSLALFIVLFGTTILILGFTELIGSSLSSFSKNSHLYEDNLNKISIATLEFFKSKGFDISVSKLSSMFDISKVMSLTTSFLKQLGSLMGNAFTIFFLIIFLLLEANSFHLKLKYSLRDSKKSYSYINTIINSIRHYLSIKTMTSLLTGILIWLSLLIIGVDYAIIWGLIAFLLNYIPNFGSIIASIPALLFSAVQLGLTGVLWTGIVFVVVNMLIGNVIEPKVMGKGLGLSTYVVFLSLLFWGFILGTIGMFLSIPLTMTIKIILEQYPSTKSIALFLGSSDEINALVKKE
jgi:predicted PurR-regulated permease PerM